MRKLILALFAALFSTPGFGFTLTPTGMDTSGLFHISSLNDNFIFPGHTGYSGTTPTIAAGTGAGTSPALTVTGVDNGGYINLTTGTLPAGSNATVATITYTAAFPNGTIVVLTPQNAASAALSGSGSPFSPVGTTTGFTITSGITGLVGATNYRWSYSVIGW